jgi:hypothetical protein
MQNKNVEDKNIINSTKMSNIIQTNKLSSFNSRSIISKQFNMGAKTIMPVEIKTIIEEVKVNEDEVNENEVKEDEVNEDNENEVNDDEVNDNNEVDYDEDDEDEVEVDEDEVNDDEDEVNEENKLVLYGSNTEEPYNKMVSLSHNQFDNAELLFLSDTLSGYILRQNYEFCKQALTEAPMSCSEDYISITRSNGDNTLVNSDKIYAKKLVNYYVNKSLWNCPEERSHHINYDLKEFYGHIKSVAKKQGIRLYQYKQWPDTLFGQIYGGSKTSHGHFSIKTQKFNLVKYNIEDGYTPGDKPNVKIPLAAFCGACSEVYKHNYPNALIKCFPKGAILMGISQTGSSLCVEEWGDCSIIAPIKSRLSVNKVNPAKQGFFVATVKPDLVKSISKLNNLCVDGIISVFSVQNGLIRLEIDIGVIGEKVIHLIDSE